MRNLFSSLMDYRSKNKKKYFNFIALDEKMKSGRKFILDDT